MLDPTRLRLLSELARRGTMIAVGEACRMSSSAVSQQLATLEREAGVPLFTRAGRRVRLTAEGERLVGHAHTILHAMEAAEEDLRAAATPRGPLRVACFGTATAARLLPAIVAARERHPELRVIVHEMEPRESLAALADGGCDVAITFGYNVIPEDPPPGTTRHRLGSEPIMLALPDGRDTRTLHDEAWIAGSAGTTDHELLDRVCALAGFRPNVVHTADDYALVLRMVRAGLGVALVPELVASVTGVPDGVALRPLPGPPITRTTHAVLRTETPAVRALLSLLTAPR
ncbi:LysR family transcriptional regulator [Catenuloplanes japonicus]|uniref:LysR family transcriptional regulator n=1 Tax=Catenuloplanes japonicus TaxID=33876 RepID=UPI0007C4FF3F|nr:LysR family transcriptional regulator [Catenuloplanes japonicus]